jgi:hypothetical protein
LRTKKQSKKQSPRRRWPTSRNPGWHRSRAPVELVRQPDLAAFEALLCRDPDGFDQADRVDYRREVARLRRLRTAIRNALSFVQTIIAKEIERCRLEAPPTAPDLDEMEPL